MNDEPTPTEVEDAITELYYADIWLAMRFPHPPSSWLKALMGGGREGTGDQRKSANKT